MEAQKNLKIIFQQRRDQAIIDRDERKKEIYTFIPKIQAIDLQIKKMGLKVAMASLRDPADAAMELKIIEEEIKVLQRDKAILLTEHNIPHDYLDVHYLCRDCEDTGFQENGKKCHCYKQEIIKQSYKFSNITEILKDENFENFKFDIFSEDFDDMLQKSPRAHMMEVYERSRIFVNQFTDHKDNFFFYGHTGLGKTYLCNCIAKALLDQGHTVLYQTAFRIIDTISNYRFTPKKTDEMRFNYNLLITCDLLIIDDLGTEMINSFSNTELFNIVNTRLLEGKSTIISTNFAPAQIAENYSDRIASRLFGHYEFVPFVGKDLRWEI